MIAVREQKPIPRTQAERDAQADWPKLIRFLAWQIARWGFDWIPRDERVGIAGLACARANAAFDPDRCPPPYGSFPAYLQWASILQVRTALKTWLSEHNRNDVWRYADKPCWETMSALAYTPAERREKPWWWYRLSRQDRLVVALRTDGMNNKEVGAAIGGITGERVRQLLQAIAGRLIRWGAYSAAEAAGKA